MDTVIRFRADSGVRSTLEAAAARKGLTLSEWIRQTLIRAAGNDPEYFGLPEIADEVVVSEGTGGPAGKLHNHPPPLTREEREAKIDAFQRKMAKGKK